MLNKNKKALLNEIVSISPYYQRSIRLSDDLGDVNAVSGYVCHETAKKVLASMSQQIALTNQRAFTWTGPYGSGKSSLALALATVISGKHKIGINIKNALSTTELDYFDKAFPVTTKGWLILPLVGGFYSASDALAKVIEEKTGRVSRSTQDVLANLRKIAQSNDYDGVALIIDEMGKFLEASSFEGDDIFLFQELAELSSRTKSNFLLIGILHQAFRQYAKFQQFSEKIQNEWEKVQGRFSDIPLVASTDEVVELVGNAIHNCSEVSANQAIYEFVCTNIRNRRPAIGHNLEMKLSHCWPLHPVTALLLGPISRRQFGQNERSVFGFLGSLEAYGFQDFLRSTYVDEHAFYTPENYWDYLKANIEPAIIASNDSHRWAVACDAVERAEAKGSRIHASVVKNIAVIDLFKNGSGLAADNDILKTFYPKISRTELDSILDDLSNWKIIVFRKFNDAWSIFEGSDFDIDIAVTEIKSKVRDLEFGELSEIANFHPIVAKRHLHQTGTLRWMGFSIVSASCFEQHVKKLHANGSEFGQFILVADGFGLDWQGYLQNNSFGQLAIGVTEKNNLVIELAKELTILNRVAERPELEGDAVAKKEVSIRLSAIKHKLDSEISHVIKDAIWFSSVYPTGCQPQSLSKLASDLADRVFYQAPKLWSELINRDSLSGSSVKARRELLYKMLTHEMHEGLGIDGFPAEKGLYLTCLKSTGLHCKDVNENKWCFTEPLNNDRNMSFAWKAAYDLVSSSESNINCGEIYKMWGAAPFGIKAGVMPIILWSLILSCKGKLALYKDSYYIPEPSTLDIDEMLQNINRFELRGVLLTPERLELLADISKLLGNFLGERVLTDPLSAARGLVKIVYNLPSWVKKTRTLSRDTLEFRDCILRASDPHKVIFHDVYHIFKTKDVTQHISRVIRELLDAYPNLLNDFTEVLNRQLSINDNQYDDINRRANNISEVSGSLKLNAFINRLKSYDGSHKAIADILSLLSGKSLELWSDLDVKSVKNEIAISSKEFRLLETISSVNNRKPYRNSIGIVYGAPGANLIKEFDFDEAKIEQLEQVSNKIIKKFEFEGVDIDTQFAILAKAFEALCIKGDSCG
ncbi:hypothetical protein ACBI01_004198 [Aeromonas veronii]